MTEKMILKKNYPLLNVEETEALTFKYARGSNRAILKMKQ